MMGGFGGLGMLLWVALIVAAVWWITQLATSLDREMCSTLTLRGPVAWPWWRCARWCLTPV